MYFKQFLHDEFGCSSYFIASRFSRDAAVIDPQWEVQPYLDLAAERGYTIRAVIDTHLHADHISGNRRLAAATGATLYLHEAAEVHFPFQPLRDGEVVRVGQIELHVVHTPGHRPEAISLLVVNPLRSPEPSMVLSGDTLFVGDVGRPDFGGPEGARQQYASIQRLLGLADWVEVFPAHFEGSCGKGMCGRPSSTIGFERRYNPILQLSREQFEQAASEPPARPLNMTAILAMNQGVADYRWVATTPLVEAVPEITVEAAPAWLQEHHPFILDVREPAEYRAGHLPGAVLLPQADLAVRLAEVPRERKVLVVCAAGARSRRAAGFLLGCGFPQVTSLAGGTNGWRAAGLPLATGTLAEG
ncbi:MAG: MBL fold metallo-hydrolase [Chloroflexi bacterium]|nr:MBL fold metallo-hydrolase [Chloroflexota bacterium]